MLTRCIRTATTVFLLAALAGPPPIQAQFIAEDELIFLTAEWEGERFPDGRPRVPDDIIERMGNISIEEAWTVLRNRGYNNQFAGDWKMVHDDVPIVGRVVTAAYLPSRPELADRITERGHERGESGPMNSWPIDALEQGDVYVADGMGKIDGGTLIGNNLATAIYARSGNGVIFDGALRDLGALEEMEAFNAYVRDWHPSFMEDMMLGGLNVPIRIGEALVLPGDVVLAEREGIVFVPAHLARVVVETAEVVVLRDRFGQQRLEEGTYTPGQIDSRWTEAIRDDFFGWLEENVDDPPVSEERIREIFEERTW